MDKLKQNEERQAIPGWVQDAFAHKAAWSSGEEYGALLAALERTNKQGERSG